MFPRICCGRDATATPLPMGPRHRPGCHPRRSAISFAAVITILAYHALPYVAAQPLRLSGSAPAPPGADGVISADREGVKGDDEEKLVAVSDKVVAPSDSTEPPGILNPATVDIIAAVPKATETFKLKKINSPLPKMRLHAEAMDGTENGGWSQSPVALKHNDARLKTLSRVPVKRYGVDMAPRAILKGTASSPMDSDLSIKDSKGNDGIVKLAPPRGKTGSKRSTTQKVKSVKRGPEVCQTVADCMTGITAILALAAFSTPIVSSVALTYAFGVGGAGLGLLTTSMSIFDTCGDSGDVAASIDAVTAHNIARAQYNHQFQDDMEDEVVYAQVEVYGHLLSDTLNYQLFHPDQYLQAGIFLSRLKGQIDDARSPNHRFFTLPLNMLLLGQLVQLGKSKMMAACYGQSDTSETNCFNDAVTLQDDIRSALEYFEMLSPPNPDEPQQPGPPPYFDSSENYGNTREWLVGWLNEPDHKEVTIRVIPGTRKYHLFPHNTDGWMWCNPRREQRYNGVWQCCADVPRGQGIAVTEGDCFSRFEGNVCYVEVTIGSIVLDDVGIFHRQYSECQDAPQGHDCIDWIFRSLPWYNLGSWGEDNNDCGDTDIHHQLSEYNNRSDLYPTIVRAYNRALELWYNRLRRQQITWWEAGVGNVDDFNAAREAFQQAVDGDEYKNLCCSGHPTLEDANLGDQLAKLHDGCRCIVGVHGSTSNMYHCQISHTISANPSGTSQFWIGRTSQELFFTHIDVHGGIDVDVRQCRNGEQFWTGSARVWTTQRTEDSVSHEVFMGQRHSGIDGNADPPQWLPGDVLVPPSYSCSGMQAGLQEYTCPATFHCAATNDRHDRPIPFIADEHSRVIQMCRGEWAITVIGGGGADFLAQEGSWIAIFGHNSGSITIKQCRGSVEIDSGNIRWRPGARGYVRASFYDPSWDARWNPKRGTWNDGDIVILDSHECQELE